jgi:hypothetical protein
MIMIAVPVAEGGDHINQRRHCDPGPDPGEAISIRLGPLRHEIATPPAGASQ